MTFNAIAIRDALLSHFLLEICWISKISKNGQKLLCDDICSIVQYTVYPFPITPQCCDLFGGVSRWRRCDGSNSIYIYFPHPSQEMSKIMENPTSKLLILRVCLCAVALCIYLCLKSIFLNNLWIDVKNEIFGYTFPSRNLQCNGNWWQAVDFFNFILPKSCHKSTSNACSVRFGTLHTKKITWTWRKIYNVMGNQKRIS